MGKRGRTAVYATQCYSVVVLYLNSGECERNIIITRVKELFVCQVNPGRLNFMLIRRESIFRKQAQLLLTIIASCSHVVVVIVVAFST